MVDDNTAGRGGTDERAQGTDWDLAVFGVEVDGRGAGAGVDGRDGGNTSVLALDSSSSKVLKWRLRTRLWDCHIQIQNSRTNHLETQSPQLVTIEKH